MSQLMSWFAMGGYGAYVWPSYGLVFGVLIMNMLHAQRTSHRVQHQLKQWFKRQKV